MKRREFFGLLGGTIAAALAAPVRAQQRPTVGILVSASAAGYQAIMGPILKGLGEAGYADGKNLTIEYRWADYNNDRLPALAADLVSHQVA